MPCTCCWRNSSAQVSASCSDCTQPARVCCSLGTTTRTPVFLSASSVWPRTLAASSALNDPRLAGMKPRVISFRGKPIWLLLSVTMLITIVPFGRLRRRDGLDFADLHGQVHRLGDVFGHHRGLQRRRGRTAPGEHAMTGQQDGRRPVLVLQNRLADMIALDCPRRGNRESPPRTRRRLPSGTAGSGCPRRQRPWHSCCGYE